ncbi:hypothetical protein P171DRAFT_489658 [Karstenula rhodostoma CBS 690.94]|uniref:RING-type domain-containing protein n=1 Tax=Karstenula rhodostoma CBS 690.94 TaxID=1392251 RepID=A0A9P4U864_9PLEO|nr:hypothetical protein P171DRAFT_489658 [Karstenula rhodostoma CBS 690.94]
MVSMQDQSMLLAADDYLEETKRSRIILEEDDVCMLCLQDAISGPFVTNMSIEEMTCCNAHVHYECLGKWVKGITTNRNLCPFCRTPICQLHPLTSRQEYEKQQQDELSNFEFARPEIDAELWMWIKMRAYDEVQQMTSPTGNHPLGQSFVGIIDRMITSENGYHGHFGEGKFIDDGHRRHGEAFLKTFVALSIRDCLTHLGLYSHEIASFAVAVDGSIGAFRQSVANYDNAHAATGRANVIPPDRNVREPFQPQTEPSDSEENLQSEAIPSASRQRSQAPTPESSSVRARHRAREEQYRQRSRSPEGSEASQAISNRDRDDDSERHRRRRRTMSFNNCTINLNVDVLAVQSRFEGMRYNRHSSQPRARRQDTPSRRRRGTRPAEEALSRDSEDFSDEDE